MRLEIQHLQKSFSTKQVLKDMSLTAESGKALGLLGRNGAGKTTTIRILLDVFQSDGDRFCWMEVQSTVLKSKLDIYQKKGDYIQKRRF